MAFDTSRKRGNIVASETVSFAADSSDVDSSVIDFHKTDRALTVMVINEEGSALNATTDVDLLASNEENGTFGVLAADVIADFSDGVALGSHDPTTSGAAPYLKVRLDPDGIMASESVTIVVLQNDNAAVR